MRRRIDQTPPREIYQRSAAVCNRLFTQPEYRRAEIVMIYLSMPKEVDTNRIALHCWSNLKRVLAPRMSWEQRRMLPTEINSLTSDVCNGVIGVPEPVDGLPLPVADIDLVIVPGLAFDKSGNRLGRGRGLYDRFLAHRDFRGVACGLALEEQMVPEVPLEEIDVRVNMLVTDARVRRFKR